MQSVLDSSYASSLTSRVKSLRPDAPRQWGKMSVDQMLQHINRGMEMALGRRTAEKAKMPLPAPLMRLLVLTMPWPKGAPTFPELIVTDQRNFEAERSQCLALLEELSARKASDQWPVHPGFGDMGGKNWGKLQAKHVDHHLKQFGS